MLLQVLLACLLLLGACTQQHPEDGNSEIIAGAGGKPSVAKGGEGGSTEAGAGGSLENSAGVGGSPTGAAGKGTAGQGGGHVAANAGQGGAGGSMPSVAGTGGYAAVAGQGGETAPVGGAGGETAEAGHGGVGGETAVAGQGGVGGSPVAGQGGVGGSPVAGQGGVGGQEPEPECDSSDMPYCDGSAVVSCQAGNWVTSACQFVCSGGACGGSCMPGAQRCSTFGAQTCSAQGVWITNPDSCTPDARRCSGQASQVCNQCGVWVTDQTCPYVCSGAGVCSGSCQPETERCSGKDSQMCNASGNWETQVTCPYVCGGAGVCSGVCVPGTQRCSGAQIQQCTAQGTWGAASNCAAVTGAVVSCNANTNSCEASCAANRADCDGDMSNGCEVDTSSDSDNCGACGHSCCGGTCGNSQCGVYETSILTSASNPNGYAVDGQYVYWIDGFTLYRELRMGGERTAVVTINGTNRMRFVRVVVHGGTIAWLISVDTAQGATYAWHLSVASTNGNANYAQSVMNGTATIDSTLGAFTFRTLSASPKTIGVDDTRVFWTDSTHLYWELFGSTVVTAVATSMSTAEAVSSGDYVYTKGSGMWAPLVRYSLNGSATVLVEKSNPDFQVWGLSLDSTNLYFAERGIGIQKMPIAGGAAVQVVSESFTSATGTQTVSDETSLYFDTNVSNQPSLHKVGVNGGQVTTLATFPTNKTLRSLRAVDQCLYFTINGRVNALAVAP